MSKYLILVEGIADLVFIKDFIEVHYGYIYRGSEKINDEIKEIIITNNNEDFVKIFVLKSKNSLDDPNMFKLVSSDINKESYNNTVLILDADNDFNQSQTQANKYVLDLSLTNSYLFPNNENVGDLETILENIQVHKNIANCWSNFETCIDGIGAGYTIPAKKSKIHTYLEVLNPNTKKGKENCKERNRDYKDTAIWSINDLAIPYIQNLKTFLDQYLK